MGEHAAALEAACTAISDLAAAPAVVRPAALDGDGVQAKNQLEMAGIDLLSALDATGKARRESDLAAPASGDVGATVQGPARVRGRRSTAPRSGPLPSCHLLDGPGVSRVTATALPGGVVKKSCSRYRTRFASIGAEANRSRRQ